ncbi:MAG TPA: CapA family protein [Caldilineaceae bacterium]|nr:CapA family protein [Caldilineaceae bacterium]
MMTAIGLILVFLSSSCTYTIADLAIHAHPVPPAGHFIQAATTTEVLDGPVTVALAGNVPDPYARQIFNELVQVTTVEGANGAQPLNVLASPDNARAVVRVARAGTVPQPLLERFYAVVVPFTTTLDDIPRNELQQRWQGFGDAPLIVPLDAAALLQSQWGRPATVLGATDELLAALEATPGAWGILPFDQLDPRYKVLSIDGINPLSNQFDATTYPLGVALTIEGMGAHLLTAYLQKVLGEPLTNRDPAQLTTLLMTGVTAMARATAAVMEREGVLFPAAVVSATFAAADITHISNEIPFLDDCVVNNTLNNLVLCSHTDYWATLEAVGTDIVGLSGNHVNDFGYEGARRSLQFYQDHDIPIYGSGFTPEEACAPLLWEHNGNTFAFLAALAYGPSSAWVTDEEPGACYYYDHKEEVLAHVRDLASEVDIVAVELQYEETYFPYPTANQVIEFRELRAAGADIVTGVQSHVPQAMEPYGRSDAGGPGMIVYGLGNLFFDQMWSWETRTELYARHTIYQGQLISTEILTGVLEDYAQPRWTTPQERVALLTTIFEAAPARE